MQTANLNLKEVQQVLDWAAAEGWNPGHDDGAAFFKTDPNGFFGVFDQEQLVAAISVIKYDSTHGFLGLYICHPDCRGKGIGLSVWNTGIAYLDGMNVGLDGVIEQQPNYHRSGFELAYRNIRYQGRLTESSKAATDYHDYHCRQIVSIDWPELHDLDLYTHGINRRSFIDHWLLDTEFRKSLVCVRGDDIVGVGTIRQCKDGLKIGPLIAKTATVAQTLLTSLSNLFSDNEIVLDVPEPNALAVDLAERYGLKPVFETARMYRGQAPDYQLDRLYGVSTFELG